MTINNIVSVTLANRCLLRRKRLLSKILISIDKKPCSFQINNDNMLTCALEHVKKLVDR